jgi:hypothetical protein
VFDDKNQLIEHITPESQSKKYIKYKKNIRDRNVKISSDEAIIVRYLFKSFKDSKKPLKMHIHFCFILNAKT